MTESSKKDYNNGRIYCLRNDITDDIYIGSTTQALSQRMQKHRSSMKNERNNKTLVYRKMTELGAEHFYIELIEEYPCGNVEQLRKREGELIRELKPTLNKRIEARTMPEWREDNRDQIVKYRKNWYQDNREVILERVKNYSIVNEDKIKEQRKQRYEENGEEIREKRKLYRKQNRDKINEQKRQYYHDNKEEHQQRNKEHYINNKAQINEAHKKYYEQNKDTFLEKQKQYRENNQLKIKEWFSKLMECPCGKTHTQGYKSKHLKSKHHQNYENLYQKIMINIII